MTGPGREIAKVSVRVIPNTKGFEAQVRREIEGMGPFKVKVIADLDTTKAQAALDKFAAQRKAITVTVDLDKGLAETEKAALQKPITIPANVDIDKGLAEAEKAALKKPIHIKAIVDLDKNSFAPGILGATRFGAALNSIQTSFANIRSKSANAMGLVGTDFERAGGRAGKAFGLLGRDSDKQFSHIGNTAAIVGGAIGSVFSSAARAIGSGLSTAVSSAGSALSTVGGILGTVGSKIAAVAPAVLEAASAFGSGAIAAIGFGAALFKMSAIATVVAEAGAGITAAWGFASTAIAAVPAAIALIGAPIAAIAIGMDGIKKAAAAIKPEFDALQKSVSATFEKGLTPVLKDLAQKVFPTLKTGLNQIATSLVSAASKLESFISSGTGLALLGQVFSGVSAEIDRIGPGLQSLTEGFLRLAGNQHALDALGNTINELGNQINLISNNPSLNKAFDGLGQVLVSVTKGFGNLVNNGIKLFAAAAPGISAGLDSITSFFGKFNWEQLGTAVGNAFKGLGSALNEIPKSTIDGIGKSFESLGAALNSQNFKDGVAGIASAVPVIVDLGTKGVQAFGVLGQSIGGFVQIVKGTPQILDSFRKSTAEVLHDVTGLNTALLKGNEAFDEFGGVVNVGTASVDAAGRSMVDLGGATDDVANQMKVLEEATAKIPPTIAKTTQQAADDFALLPDLIGTSAAKIPPAILNPLIPLPPQVGQVAIDSSGRFVDGFKNLPTQGAGILTNMPQIVLAPVQPLPGLAGALATQTSTSFTAGLGSLLTGAAQATAGVPPVFANMADILQAKLPISGQRVGEAFGSGANSGLSLGLATVGQTTTQGFVPVQDAGTAGVQGLVDSINAVLPGVGTAFQTAFTNIQTLATTAFTALTTQFTTVGTALTAMGTSFTTLGATLITFGTSITAITAQFTLLGTGFTLLNANLVTFGTSFTTINASLVLFGTALTLVNAGIVVFGTSFLTLNPALLLFGQNLTLVNSGFTAFSAGLLLVNAALVAFGTGLTTAGAAATAFAAAVQAAFTAVNASVTQGMAQAVAAVDAGFTNMVAAADAGGVNMTTSATTMMTNFVKAVTDGFVKATDAVTQGVAAMVKAVDVNALVDVGGQLIEGMATGMIAHIPAVEAAARQAVQKAVAAANAEAKINSPSRVMRDGPGIGLTEGLAVGQLKGIPLAEDAARQAVRASLAAAQREVDATGALQFAVTSLSNFGSSIASQVSAAINAQAGTINLTTQTILDGKVLDERTQQVLATWERQILAGRKAA